MRSASNGSFPNRDVLYRNESRGRVHGIKGCLFRQLNGRAISHYCPTFPKLSNNLNSNDISSRSKSMKVILRQDFEQLGKIGDVVDVKDGYARNYLIPRNLAYQATESSMRILEEEKKQFTKKQDKEKREAELTAAELAKLSITIKMKVGEDDKLFGSVTSQMISDAVVEKGVKIDKRQIVLEEQIKSLGIYEVPVKFPGGVSGIVKVWVVRE